MNPENYPSDLTDAQWGKLLPYLPTPQQLGSPLKWGLRLILNAILSVVKSGCQWRMLPHDMPPWQTVYYHFRKWQATDTWLLIHQALHEETRHDVGKAPSPTANLSRRPN